MPTLLFEVMGGGDRNTNNGVFLRFGFDDSKSWIKYAIVENNNTWGTLYVNTWPNNMIWGSYENEVQSMKIWLEKRFQWPNEQFTSM